MFFFSRSVWNSFPIRYSTSLQPTSHKSRQPPGVSEGAPPRELRAFLFLFELLMRWCVAPRRPSCSSRRVSFEGRKDSRVLGGCAGQTVLQTVGFYKKLRIREPAQEAFSWNRPEHDGCHHCALDGSCKMLPGPVQGPLVFSTLCKVLFGGLSASALPKHRCEELSRKVSSLEVRLELQVICVMNTYRSLGIETRSLGCSICLRGDCS